jgi:hypothetical protein
LDTITSSTRNPTCERKTDTRLWNEVQKKAAGTESERLEAVDLVFQSQNDLPEESAKLILRLAGHNQPVAVRLAVVGKLGESRHLPGSLLVRVLNVLKGDPNQQVKLAADAIFTQIMQPISDLTKQLGQIAVAIKIPQFELPSLSARQLEQLKLVQLHLQQAVSVTAEVVLPHVSVANLIKPVDLSKQLLETIVRSTQVVFPSYYPQPELEVIGKIYPKFRKPKGHVARLSRKLAKCEPGKEFWKEYQDVCCEILTHVLVPPLLEPTEESTTKGRDQRRDLIFHIPYDAGNFWSWIRMTYKSLALIVECKNYSASLGPNQVVITSKYFGEKRLGLFGIIACRKGLSESARREQERLWVDEGKMILALTDDDLNNLLSLKETGEDPLKVIDNAIRLFRQSF